MKKLSVFSLIFSLLFILSCEDKVEKDTTPPELTIVSPTSGSTVGEIVQIKVQTTDESGILKVDFYIQNSIVLSDTTLPYEYEWNTTTNQDGEYKVKVVSFDTKENFVESEFSVTVDNESKKPSPLDIVSVEYDLEKMTVKWNQSQDSDFKQYNLHYSDSENGTKTQIRTFTDKSTTSFDTTTFDPTKENWYFLEVLDNFGLSNIGKGKTNQIDSPPIPSQIDTIIYSYLDDYFSIKWTENKETDFKSYTIYESDLEDMTSKTKLLVIDNSTQLINTIEVGKGLYKYYQIETEDVWGLKSQSEIKRGSSWITFINEYGGTNSEETGYSVQQTSDGGYIFTGGSYVNNSNKIWLVKINFEGNIEWDKYLGDGSGKSVQQTIDGGYIVSSSTNIYNGNLIKFDSQGNIEWKKDLDGLGDSVHQTSDGGFIVSGKTTSRNKDEIKLFKIDSQGNQEWTKFFLEGDWSNSYSVQQTIDGGYIISGNTGSNLDGGGYDNNVLLIKTDSQGDEVWRKIFGGDWNRDVGHSVQQTINGGYIVLGNGESEGKQQEIWLLKIDSQGNQEWDNKFGTVYSDYGESVEQTQDGGYIISGSYNGNFTYIKTDSQGNQEWGQGTEHNSLYPGVSYSYDISQTKDNGYIVIGHYNKNNPGTGVILLMKTDSEGNIE